MNSRQFSSYLDISAFVGLDPEASDIAALEISARLITFPHGIQPGNSEHKKRIRQQSREKSV
jgi:hypothetical protein